jgi:ABC-type polysaccharide/polyol phosphate export permease
VLGSHNPPTGVLASSVAMALLIFVTGLVYFRRMEQTFADVV